FWDRFASACQIDSAGLNLDQERVNESMGVVEAELLRRVNETLAGRIENNRDQSLLLRDLFAHQVLVPQGNEPIAISDEQYDEATQRADEAITQLQESGVSIHGDLEDIRATRVSGRTPDQVSDPELLEVALESIAQLLLRIRAERAESVPTTGGGSLPRRMVRALSAPAVESRRRRLENRLAELEEHTQQRRLLEQRVADLADLVTVLLQPVAKGTGTVSEEALEEYRRDSL
ncbi:MAG TPA: hypothetical protein PKM12_06610, partial [Marmoricola sp.]|nr:hypothetical protein [Marmoricola sp.]